MKNIVLIGMPSSGKTTIAGCLAEILKRDVVDTDAEIVKKEGKSIPEIFGLYGEKYFRESETGTVIENADKEGIIISCGGGVILKEENMAALKKNGIIVFLERDVDLLSTDGRPLSKDVENLKKMAEIRLPLYKKYADITVKNDKTPMETAKEIVRLL